ncbi:MauE/DoxX family redox-associated membrane protein [Microbispora sp. NPDC046973]|uniref:MauE/DoxX family redox-associated membrane protein n=1 Tax=Microbispora sp. NPDC046973 TaxID=3155022 RepID=UPI0033E28F10
MDYLIVGCRTLLALLFLASATGKLRGADAYRDFVAATGRLAPRFLPTRRAAVAVVATEIAIVALVAVPATAAAGFLLAAGLLTAFTLAILAALRRDERAPCACFGRSRRRLGRGHVVRNLLLLVVAGLGFAGSAIPVFPAGPAETAGVLTAVTAGAVGALLVSFTDDFIDLFSPAA